MTLLIVQTILAGLGLIAGVVIALFGPGKRWFRWPLAAATGAAIAFSARPDIWQGEFSPIQQLFQSLSLSAVVALIALLAMMLLRPTKRARQIAKTQEQELDFQNATYSAPQAYPTHGSLDEIADTADAENTENTEITVEPGQHAVSIDFEKVAEAKIASEDEHTHMHLLKREKSVPSDEENVSLQSEGTEPQWIDSTSDSASNYIASNDVASNDVEASDNVEWEEPKGATADIVSLDERREKNSTLELELDDTLELELDDELDLASSDDIFEAMREAETELGLSEDPDWLKEDASADEIAHDLAVELATGTASITDSPADVEDAEILEDEMPAVPKHASEAQRRSINQLSADTDILAKRLSEWNTQTEENDQTAWSSSPLEEQSIQQQHRRILAENDFRLAAVELIETQRDVMNEMMSQIGTLGTQREEDLATLAMLQEKTIEQRRIARQAAFLARKAAADKRELAYRLIEEQRNHERTRGAARRAMGIARDAVDKLSEQERMLDVSTEPVTI